MGDTDPRQMLRDVIDRQTATVAEVGRPIPHATHSNLAHNNLVEPVETLIKGASRVVKAAGDYERRLERLHADKHTMPAEGFELERLRARDEFEQAMREASDTMETAQVIAEAAALTLSLPQIDSERETLLRDEARMVLDGVDGSNVETRVEHLAKGDRRQIAALVASPWGRSYLEARGVPDAADVHGRIVDAVALGAQQNPNASVTEQEASKALLTLRRQAPGLRVAAARYGHMVVDDSELADRQHRERMDELQRLARTYR